MATTEHKTKKELEKERKLAEKVKNYTYVRTISPSDLPLTARIFWCLVKDFQLKVAYLFVTLANFCTLAPRIVTKYAFDGALLHHLLCQIIVLSESSGGKSFAGRLRKIILRPLLERDKKAEEVELKYAEMKRMKGASKDKPEEPVTVRYCLQKFTKNKIVKRAHMAIRKYGNPIIFNVFTDELSTLLERRGSFGDLRDFEKIAYDWGSEISVDTNCDQSYNATVDINWISIFCTTPSILQKYIDGQACESGNANRKVIVDLGDRIADTAPICNELTDADMTVIEQMQDQLMNLTYTADDKLQPLYEMDMSWLYDDVELWCAVQRDIIIKTSSHAHDSFYKRSSLTAFRLCTMLYYLWGERKDKRKNVRKVYHFMAQYILEGQLRCFGKMYEKHRINLDDDSEKKAPIYDRLPKRFTRDQLKKTLEEDGLKTPARILISQWKKRGLIYEISGELDVFEKNY